jgi:hypothetical protein
VAQYKPAVWDDDFWVFLCVRTVVLFAILTGTLRYKMQILARKKKKTDPQTRQRAHLRRICDLKVPVSAKKRRKSFRPKVSPMQGRALRDLSAVVNPECRSLTYIPPSYPNVDPNERFYY